MFDGFTESWVPAGDIDLFVRHCDAGPQAPVVVLLHGHPRTSSTWHQVAPALVEAGFTVVCPDLPGYGRSGKPSPSADHSPHSKRAHAQRVAMMMTSLDHERFSVVGHDRGSYLAFRLAMDSPDRIDRAALLDCLPIIEHLNRMSVQFATDWYHWFFFAQPHKPEQAILADPDAWYGGDPAVMGAANFAEFRSAVNDPEVVTGMLEDYRAGLSVDRADEEADQAAGRRLTVPTLVLWSTRDDLEQLFGDPVAIWRDWADDVRGYGIDSGHHMAEEAPQTLTTALVEFFGARPR